MNECPCGLPAVVRFVRYNPARVWLLCAPCALVQLGDEPARLWAVIEATGLQEVVSA